MKVIKSKNKHKNKYFLKRVGERLAKEHIFHLIIKDIQPLKNVTNNLFPEFENVFKNPLTFDLGINNLVMIPKNTTKLNRDKLLSFLTNKPLPSENLFKDK